MIVSATDLPLVVRISPPELLFASLLALLVKCSFIEGTAANMFATRSASDSTQKDRSCQRAEKPLVAGTMAAGTGVEGLQIDSEIAQAAAEAARVGCPSLPH